MQRVQRIREQKAEHAPSTSDPFNPQSIKGIADSVGNDSPFPPTFRILAWSNLAAQSAEQIGLAATPLIAVLLFNAGAGETGLLQMALTLPFLLLTLPAGVMADRASRKRIMVSAEAIRAVSLLAVPVLMIFGLLTLPLLAVLGFLGASGTVAFSVAAPAMIPALVPRSHLAIANGRIELARSTAFAAGPALGGLIVEWSGASIAYAFAAALSACAVLYLTRFPESAHTSVLRRHVLREVSDGARFVLSHPFLRPIMITSIFFNLSWFVLQAAYVVYAVQELGLSPAMVGMTLGIYGVGMVVGALLAPSISQSLPFGKMLVVGPLFGLIGALIMLLTLRVPSPGLAALSFFSFGFGPIMWVITTTTLRQSVTPDHLLGRASSILMLTTFGARPLGALIGAAIGGLYGAHTCVIVAASGFLMQFIVIITSRVSRLNRLPEIAVAAMA